jgi:hypothetical protein
VANIKNKLRKGLVQKLQQPAKTGKQASKARTDLFATADSLTNHPTL